jgi:hypothetical protein
MKKSPYKLDIRNWGEAGWTFLTSVALMFPKNATPKTRQEYLEFFKNIGNVLPCSLCEAHYNSYLTNHPLPTETGGPRELSLWLHNLHNEVNKNHDEKEWTYIEMVKQYMPIEMAKDFLDLSEEEINEMNKLKTPSTHTQYPTWLIVTLAIVIVVLLILLILAFLKIVCVKKK